jgi:alpha-mannosidase
MLRHPDYTRGRIARTAMRLRQLIYADVRPVDSLQISPCVGRISYDAARALPYRDVSLGEQLGPTWSTYWLDVAAVVPDEWARERVDLRFTSHSEATLWIEGRSVQGLNSGTGSPGDRSEAVLSRTAGAGERLAFMIEIACNGKFGELDRPFASLEPVILDRCEIARFDEEAWKLFHDLDVLRQLEAQHGAGLEPALAGRLLAELNRFCNVWSAGDRGTWGEASELLAGLYRNHNGSYGHDVSAIGHAHIDTAWLWPIAETYRKCVRTFSSQTAYMDDYPEYRFACSQAQQYTWIKERNPDLYRRIEERVERGQFIPVGGTWIEPDCNIPSGESLVRQFLLGQSFFEREFGRRCREFWNPDVFGYNGQLPQIMRGAGIARFLTQKLSWNAFNKPEYHTFRWQGIDGSEVLTHFPPADTYNGQADVAEIRRSANDFKDHDRSSSSYLLFGYGDGGGGPTRDMLETLRRVGDLQGVPRTTQRTSEEFFGGLERTSPDLPVLVGELYFEYHRGTYTSQAAVKRANRKCEFLLHDVELLSALAHWRGLQDYPRGALTRLWQALCLNQFHDIIPGSSINEVYEDAHRDYAEIERVGEALRASALAALGDGSPGSHPLNTLGVERRGVVASPTGDSWLVASRPFASGEPVEPRAPVTITPLADGWQLENAYLRATVDRGGRLLGLVLRESDRQVLREPGNVLEIYQDMPVNWDAWDIDPFHLETREDCPAAHEARVVCETPLRAEIAFEHRIGESSTGTQTIRLDADGRRIEFDWSLDWREAQRILKVRFPVDVRSPGATYEMQFGAVERPTHYTTKHDLARYEVPGHRFADLSEHGFGVALLSESKYGWSTFGNELRMSLLRAPKMPDPSADMGSHRFAYALYPHAGGWQDGGVVAQALDFNAPLVWAPASFDSLFVVDTADLVLDTVKLAEREEALVLRLYEAHGARGRARISFGVDVGSVTRANLLEDPDGIALPLAEASVELEYGPFEIITLLVRRADQTL